MNSINHIVTKQPTKEKKTTYFFVMVWKVSPAERQVRKIASRIGLDDSELLSTVFEKMQQEYVVAEWQLPVLDSRQWEQLCCPIGLAVAVRYLSPLESSSSSLLLPDRQEDSVGTNIKERELNISVESATIMEQVGKEDIGDEVQGEKIAQCRNDLTSKCTKKRNETEKFDCKVQTSDLKETKRSLVLSDYALIEGVNMIQFNISGQDYGNSTENNDELSVGVEKFKKEITLPLEKKCTSIGTQNNLIPLSVVSSSSESSEDISHAKVVPFLSSSTEEEEEHADDDETYNYLLGSLSGDDASNSDTLFSMQNDDVTVVVSNVSSACKTAASKRKTEIKNYGHSFKGG